MKHGKKQRGWDKKGRRGFSFSPSARVIFVRRIEYFRGEYDVMWVCRRWGLSIRIKAYYCTAGGESQHARRHTADIPLSATARRSQRYEPPNGTGLRRSLVAGPSCGCAGIAATNEIMLGQPRRRTRDQAEGTAGGRTHAENVREKQKAGGSSARLGLLEHAAKVLGTGGSFRCQGQVF